MRGKLRIDPRTIGRHDLASLGVNHTRWKRTELVAGRHMARAAECGTRC